MMIDRTNLPPYGLRPVETASLHCYIWQDLADGAPHRLLEVNGHLLYARLARQDGNNGLKDCFVVAFLFAGHNNEDKGHLFNEIAIFDKRI